MMIGGDPETVKRLRCILESLAPGIGDIPRTKDRKSDDDRAERGYIHAGPAGAGHFVEDDPSTGIRVRNNAGLSPRASTSSRPKTARGLPQDQRFDLNVADIAEV